MNRRLILGICLLCAAAAGGGEPAAKPFTYQGEVRALLMNPFVAKGDGDGQLRFLLDYASRQTDPLLREMALRLAQNVEPLARGAAASGESEARKLLASPVAGPVSRDLALAILADYHAAAGRFPEAQALQARRGLVAPWLVLGPFGDYERADYYTPFAPERDGQLAAQYDWGRRTLRWRRVGAENAWPSFDPWDWTGGTRRGVVYALAQVKVEATATVRLELRLAGAGRVFLNGEELGRINRLTRELPDEVGLTGRLRPGWNRILIKILAVGERRDLALRLLDAAGAPLAGVTCEPGLELHALAAAEAIPPPAAGESKPDMGPGAFATFSQLSEELADNPTLRAALAELSQSLGLTDAALRHARQAALLEPDNPWFLALRARQELAAVHLARAPRESEAVAAYERARRSAPDFVPALLGLARFAAGRQRYREALDLCAAALKVNEKCLAALELAARLAIEKGWLVESGQWTERLASAFPDSLARRTVEALAAARREDYAAWSAAYREILAGRQADVELRGGLAERLAGLGETSAALGVIADGLRVTPDRAELFLAKAGVLRRDGRAGEEEAVLRQALGLSPDSAETWRRLGDSLARQGRAGEAAEAYGRGLALDPQQHDLRRLLAGLKNENYAFWSKYALAVGPELERAAGLAPVGSTVRVIDQSVLAVYPDGSFACYTHGVQKILNDGGVETASTLPNQGELLEARTILPDGRSLEPLLLPGQAELTMPALVPGAAVEHKYLDLSPAPFDGRLRFPRWYFRSPDTQEEFLLSQYVVLTPPDFPLAYQARNLGRQVEFAHSSEAGREVYVWTGRNMPQAVHELGAPEVDEFLPFVEIGGAATWDDVSRLLQNVYLGRLRPGFALRETLAKLGREAKNPADEAERIYRFVCDEIDDGGGNDPATLILDQRFGDRNILLLALLREAGYRAEYVVARPRAPLMYVPNWRVPHERHFPLRLVLVELPGGRQVWLDTRRRTLAFGQLLEDLAGATALVVSEAGGEFRTLPLGRAADSARNWRVSVKQATRGETLTFSAALNLGGAAGQDLKGELRQADERGRFNQTEDLLAEFLPGAAVVKLELPELEVNGPACRLECAGEAAPPLALAGGAGELPFGLPPLDLLPAEIDQPRSRQTPYLLKEYLLGEDQVQLTLPAGATFVRLPEPRLLHSRFGDYCLRWRVDGGTLTVTRRYRFDPQLVAVEDFADFFDLAREISILERGRWQWRGEVAAVPAPEPVKPAAATPAGTAPTPAP